MADVDNQGILSRASQAARPVAVAEWLVFLPALTLAAFWLGGEVSMIVLAVAAPVLLAMTGLLRRPAENPKLINDIEGLASEAKLIERLDAIVADMAVTGKGTACFVLRFDDPSLILDRHGLVAHNEAFQRTAERLSQAVRSGDVVAQLSNAGFAVGLGAIRRFDLEAAVQLAARLQSAVMLPMVVDGVTIHPSVSVGFCLGGAASAPTGAAIFTSAATAADEALRAGPSAIRAFVPEMAGKLADRAMLRAAIVQGLDDGQFRPWFQPQISTHTGAITGFEALARWHHPERGVISPGEFLPLIEEAGISERLGEVILYGALSALVRWDASDYGVPRVSVNFSASELRNPKLAEKLKWELDRFNLSPDRLVVEVLETVAARSENDVIVTNLSQIAQLGCGIDLDDFGTGQASISNIRRFSIKRIKIDRCFVTKADTDPEQKRMVSAILSLSERLGLDTIAEGVETPGEHATVAQLGCGHVQGYGIARPMAIDETFGWIERHQNSLKHVLRLGESGS